MSAPDGRRAAISVIENLYGYPGGGYNTPDGVVLIVQLIRDRGLSVFSDAGVIALANRHLELEQSRIHRRANATQGGRA